MSATVAEVERQHELLSADLAQVEAEQATAEAEWSALVDRAAKGATVDELSLLRVEENRVSLGQRRELLREALGRVDEQLREAEAGAYAAPLIAEYRELTGGWRARVMAYVDAEIAVLEAWAAMRRDGIRMEQLRARLKDKAEAAPMGGPFNEREFNSLRRINEAWFTSPKLAAETAALVREKRTKIFGA